MSDIIIGLITSACFAFILVYVFRPKLQISTMITLSDDKATSSDGMDTSSYRIKVVNRSRRSVINVKAELIFVRETPVDADELDSTELRVRNVIKKTTTIRLLRNELFEIPGYSKQDTEADYAVRFTTTANLSKSLSSNAKSYLLFRISGQDAWSGFMTTFRQTYHSPDCIVPGTFAIGPEMRIVPQ